MGQPEHVSPECWALVLMNTGHVLLICKRHDIIPHRIVAHKGFAVSRSLLMST